MCLAIYISGWRRAEPRIAQAGQRGEKAWRDCHDLRDNHGLGSKKVACNILFVSSDTLLCRYSGKLSVTQQPSHGRCVSVHESCSQIGYMVPFTLSSTLKKQKDSVDVTPAVTV